MTDNTYTQTAEELSDRVVDILEQEVDELKQELANLQDQISELTSQLNSQQREYKELSHDFDRLELYATAAIDVLGAPHDESLWLGVASSATWLLYHGLDSFNDGEPLARTLSTPSVQPVYRCNKPLNTDDDSIPF